MVHFSEAMGGNNASFSSTMAAAPSATTSALPPLAAATHVRLKPLPLLASISSRFPSRLTYRKNHLRQKLLKTQTKPYPNPQPPQSPPAEPIVPEEVSAQHNLEIPAEQFSGEASPTVDGEEMMESNSEECQLAEIRVSPRVVDATSGEFNSSSFLKFGLWLFGAFVFQTVCIVWLLGSVDSDLKDDKLDHEDQDEVSQLGVNQNVETNSRFLLNGKLGTQNGGMLHVDESQLEEKINEIRAMARDAREKERLEQKNNGSNDDSNDDDDLHDGIKSAIGKEVDFRLTNLKNRFQNRHEKLPVSSVSFLSKDRKIEEARVLKDGLEAKVKEMNDTLIFDKKHKFRNLAVEPSDKPKGFQGLKTVEETKSKQNARKNVGKAGETEKPGNESNGAKTKRNAGNPQGNNYRKPIAEDHMMSREPIMLASRNSQGLAKGNKNTTKVSQKIGRLQSKNIGKKWTETEISCRKSDNGSDMWWLRLPYVLAILMRRGGDDDEGPEGLFNLTTTSNSKDNNSSYTVAFEDHGDASNFIYLLELFFEELGDFNAEILPFSTKELKETVKSNIMKVIVVKKGELKLYAGQPLVEVETALRSLILES